MFRKVTDRVYYRPHDGRTDRPNIGLILGDSNGKDLYGHPWHYNENTFDEEIAWIPYDWDRVDAYLELLNGLDFTRCIGGHADDMSREELYGAYEHKINKEINKEKDFSLRDL